MFILIAGGGRTGTQLAIMLLAQGHQIRVVEGRRDVLARIHKELPTEVIYEGDPIRPQVLELAGIHRAQALVACTSDDAVNLVICFLARSKFGVPRTVARINNPTASWLFNEAFHVNVAVNQAQIMSSLIEEEVSLGDMMTLLKLRRGRYSLVEEKVPPGSKTIGMAIKDMGLPEGCVIAGIIRKGRLVLPRGITTLEEGDEVLALTDHEGACKLAALLSNQASSREKEGVKH